MAVEPNYSNVLCSWCGYHVFYPLEDSELVCTCAHCGEFKALEDYSEHSVDMKELQ